MNLTLANDLLGYLETGPTTLQHLCRVMRQDGWDDYEVCITLEQLADRGEVEPVSALYIPFAPMGQDGYRLPEAA